MSAKQAGHSAWKRNPAAAAAAIVALIACGGCAHRALVNLSPDILSGYGLDRTRLGEVQLYYKAVTVGTDSVVRTDDPTVFRCIDQVETRVTEEQSPAGKSDLAVGDMIVVRTGTPCVVTDVIDNGKTLRADFGNLLLDFTLSYRNGYAFALSSDTAVYRNRRYVRSRIPLVESTGLLTVARKSLTELPGKEVRIEGKRVGVEGE